MGYQQLEVWQRSRELVAKIYEITQSFPDREAFGLTSQMRRAAVSIPCNIAEGFGRHTGPANAQFLRIAKGSTNELETLLILCVDLKFMSNADDIRQDVAKVGSMLTNLIARVSATQIRECVEHYGIEDANTMPDA